MAEDEAQVVELNEYLKLETRKGELNSAIYRGDMAACFGEIGRVGEFVKELREQEGAGQKQLDTLGAELGEVVKERMAGNPDPPTDGKNRRA